MAVDAFTLAGQIITDTSKSDKPLTETQKKLLQLTQEFTKTEQAAKSSSSAIGEAAQSGAGEASGAFTGLSEKAAALGADLAAIVGPAVVVTGGMVALATAIYSVASAAAEGAGHIKDLSDQTGFSAETLSALANSLELVGGDIDSATMSLVTFQKNMEKAKDTSSDMAATFERLGVTSANNEQALRQAIKAISELTSKQEQNAVAAELFGRAGKQIAGIIRDSGGDIDAIIKKYQEYGTIVGTEAANAGDKFADTQVELRQQLKASEREFGEAFYPVVIDVMSGLAQWLRDNREAIKAWGSAIGTAIETGIEWQDGIRNIVSWLAGPVSVTLSSTTTLWRLYADAVSDAAAAGRELGDIKMPAGDLGFLGDPYRSEGGAGFDRFNVDKAFGKPKRGGGGRAPKKTSEDYGLDLLANLNRQYESLTDKTTLAGVALDLLDKKYKDITTSTRGLIMEKAALIDSTKAEQELNQKLLSVQEGVRSYYRGLLRDIEDLSSGGSTAFTEFERFVEDTNRSLKGTGKALDDFTVSYGRFLALTKTVLGMRPVGEGFIDQSAQDMETLGINTEWASMKTEALGAAMQASLGGAPELIKESDDALRELAYGLTSAFAEGLRGLDEGFKGFFRGILRGFAQMIQQMALQLLESQILKVLGSLAGGGGFWGNLIGSVTSVLGGVSGGGHSTSIHRAGGGPVSPMSSYVVGEFGPEMFVPNTPGTIVPNNQMGRNVYNINVTAPSTQSYVQPRSQWEMANAVVAALQRAA